MAEYFEKFLERAHEPDIGAEAMWDSRAADYSLSQQSERNGFPAEVTRLLTENGYLPGHTVLDVGGGTGRYALPFARVAKSVTVSDFSSEMLERARQNAEEAGLSNVAYEKLDWARAEIAGSELEKSHDVVFASMCPAVRSKSGLMKMIAAARKGCVVNQIIKTEDAFIDRLKGAAGPAGDYDPHNDRAFVQAAFNVLWEQGFNVGLACHAFREDSACTLEEAVARYGGRFASRAFYDGGRKIGFEEMAAKAVVDGRVPIKNETVLATLYWDVAV